MERESEWVIRKMEREGERGKIEIKMEGEEREEERDGERRGLTKRLINIWIGRVCVFRGVR